MRVNRDMRKVLQALFGGAYHPPLRVAPDETRIVLSAERTTEPLALVRCPTHNNPALASMIGLIGKDRAGQVCVERVA